MASIPTSYFGRESIIGILTACAGGAFSGSNVMLALGTGNKRLGNGRSGACSCMNNESSNTSVSLLPCIPTESNCAFGN